MFKFRSTLDDNAWKRVGVVCSRRVSGRRRDSFGADGMQTIFGRAMLLTLHGEMQLNLANAHHFLLLSQDRNLMAAVLQGNIWDNLNKITWTCIHRSSFKATFLNAKSQDFSWGGDGGKITISNYQHISWRLRFLSPKRPIPFYILFCFQYDIFSVKKWRPFPEIKKKILYVPNSF